MASKKQTSLRSSLRGAAKQIAGAAVQTAAQLAAEKMAAELERVIARVASAPPHVVAAAGIINGMDPTEINRRVLDAMDAHGL